MIFFPLKKVSKNVAAVRSLEPPLPTFEWEVSELPQTFSFPIFYSIIFFLNYYNVHYVNVVYTSENIGTQISVLNRDIWAKICTKIEAKTTLH